MGFCRCLFRKIGKNVLVRCSKPQFICPEVHHSWKNIAFGKLLIFSRIRIWSKSCMKVLWQLSDNLDKIAIQVSTETFWTKNVLFLIKTIFSCLRGFTDAFLNVQRKLFCQFCQNGIKHTQRNDWMKFLSYKEVELFYHLRTLNEKSLEFLPETSSQLSKLFLGVQATFPG